MKVTNGSNAILLGLSLVAISSTSFAQQESGERLHGERRGPPPQAYEACAALTTEVACSFAGRRGKEVSGMCIVDKNDESQLVCKPERRKRKGRYADAVE